MIKEKYIKRVKEISINVLQTEIESIRQKDITKTGFRVYENGYIGCAGALGDYDEKELESKAIKALDNRIPYNVEPSCNFSQSEDYTSKIISKDKIVAEIDDLLTLVRRDQPEFYFFNKINFTECEVSLINDNGLKLNYIDNYIDFGLIFKEKASINIMDGFVGFSGRKYNRNYALNLINEICNAYKNKTELPSTGMLPVVFISDDSLPFLKFLTDLDGNKFGSGSSLFSDKLGQKIFCEDLTLYQNNNPKDLPSPFFDLEGTVNENYRYVLIENGILKSPFTDKKSSRKFNLPLTGSASGDYDSAPSLGVPNLAIKSSEKTAKELLNSEMGILVLLASGGDFTPEGNFATPVQLAFLFDGEKLIGRLPELNLSSNLFDMFGESFVGVSKDSLSPLMGSKSLIMRMNVKE